MRSKHEFETLEQVKVFTPFLWDALLMAKEEVDLKGLTFKVELNTSAINVQPT